MDDDLQCPHCGGVAVVASENPSSVPWQDGEEQDLKCECCRKPLNVVCKVTRIEWHFIDDDGEEIKFDEGL